MRSRSKPERFVACSSLIVIQCECGERLVLLGREEDWYSQVHMAFECECGNKLTLDTDRVEVLADFFDTARSPSL